MIFKFCEFPRRIPIAAEIMIEAPIQHCLANKVDIAEAAGITPRTERGFVTSTVCIVAATATERSRSQEGPRAERSPGA